MRMIDLQIQQTLVQGVVGIHARFALLGRVGASILDE